MSDAKKTKKQLIEELTAARARIDELEAPAGGPLAEGGALLRTLIDALPDHIYVKDAQSRFLLNNAAHLHSLGAKSQEDVAGKTDLDLFPKELAAQYYADEQELLRSGEPLIDREEVVVNQTTGEELWVSSTKVPLRDAEGNVIGLVGITRDITERKRSQEENIRLQQEAIDAQRRSLQELSTPIIPLMERIIVMPLIGSIDSLRARDITRKLLAGIRQHRAQVVILDITGVPLVDSGVASHLNKTILAARLKGARTIVTGISDAVAETIVDLGLDWSGIETLSDLQTGLLTALTNLGFRLVRSDRNATGRETRSTKPASSSLGE